MSLRLERISKSDKRLLIDASEHYSKPKGFVGRSIAYAVIFNGVRHGSIVGGSATRHLPNRKAFMFLNGGECDLKHVVNNTFYHVKGPYPCRNFTSKVVKHFRFSVAADWFVKYNDPVRYFETLVELPRTGDLYLRDGWCSIGLTKGFTCKRTAGQGFEKWGGKRMWDTDNLRPKLVFMRVNKDVK